MTDDAQIESVARAIKSRRTLTPTNYHPDRPGNAAAAIAAYEATRPVVSDEELVEVLQNTRSLHHFGVVEGFIGHRDRQWMDGMLDGIRAVRARLESELQGCHDQRDEVLEQLATEAERTPAEIFVSASIAGWIRSQKAGK